MIIDMEVPVNAHTPSRSIGIAEFLLNLLLALLVVAAILAITSTAVGLAQGGRTLFGGRTLPVQAELPSDDIRTLPPNVRLTHDPKVTLEVRDPSRKQLLLSFGTAVGPFLLLFATLWLLRGLARSIRAGEAFGRANVDRLRRIGLLLVIGGPVVEFLNYALRVSLVNALPPSAVGDLGFPGFNIPLALMLGGLGALILAEVFADGLRLREDVEATI
jgi:hypothetical protein